jgi:hypothetical protein
MPTSSDRTEVSVHCCHGNYTVASLQTLWSDLICHAAELFSLVAVIVDHSETPVCYISHCLQELIFNSA